MLVVAASALCDANQHASHTLDNGSRHLPPPCALCRAWLNSRAMHAVREHAGSGAITRVNSLAGHACDARSTLRRLHCSAASASFSRVTPSQRLVVSSAIRFIVVPQPCVPHAKALLRTRILRVSSATLVASALRISERMRSPARRKMNSKERLLRKVASSTTVAERDGIKQTLKATLCDYFAAIAYSSITSTTCAHCAKSLPPSAKHGGYECCRWLHDHVRNCPTTGHACDARNTVWRLRCSATSYPSSPFHRCPPHSDRPPHFSSVPVALSSTFSPQIS